MPSVLTTSARTYTLEEFWALPEPENRAKPELIGGILHMSPPPTSSHDDVFSQLVHLLSRHIDEAKLDGRLLGPRSAIWKSDGTYLEPDLFYMSDVLRARFKGRNRESADLVVEILSPSSGTYDRTTKAEAYGALGVRELWLIDEESGTVEVRQHTGQGFGLSRVFTSDETLISSVFPQLALPVVNLFRD